MNYTVTKEVLSKLGEGIDKDIVRGKFGHPRFSWLKKKPKTAKQVAENLYERLNLVGITLTFDPQRGDKEALSEYLTEEITLRIQNDTI